MKKGYLEYNMFVCVRGQPSLSKKKRCIYENEGKEKVVSLDSIYCCVPGISLANISERQDFRQSIIMLNQWWQCLLDPRR